MSLEGSLTDIPLAELFQIISMANKTGSIVLHAVGASGEILLSEGKVCAVCRSTSTTTIGEILFQDGVLSPQQYQEMMYYHRHQPENPDYQPPAVWARFGIDQALVQSTLRNAVEQLIYPMFEWDGTFDYTVDDNVMDNYRLFSVNSTMIVTTDGINPQWLAMEGTRLLDEKQRNDPFDDFLQHQKEEREAQEAIAISKITTLAAMLDNQESDTMEIKISATVSDDMPVQVTESDDEISFSDLNDAPDNNADTTAAPIIDDAVMVAHEPPEEPLVRRATLTKEWAANLNVLKDLAATEDKNTAPSAPKDTTQAEDTAATDDKWANAIQLPDLDDTKSVEIFNAAAFPIKAVVKNAPPEDQEEQEIPAPVITRVSDTGTREFEIPALKPNIDDALEIPGLDIPVNQPPVKIVKPAADDLEIEIDSTPINEDPATTEEPAAADKPAVADKPATPVIKPIPVTPVGKPVIKVQPVKPVAGPVIKVSPVIPAAATKLPTAKPVVIPVIDIKPAKATPVISTAATQVTAKAAVDAAKETLAAISATKAHTPPIELVIIDDDEIYLKQLQDGLKALPANISTYKAVKSGLDAIKEFHNAEKSVVVVGDLIIARSDSSGILGGLEILGCTKEFSSEIPVILVTDFNNEDAKKQAVQLGVSHFINKPRHGQMNPDSPSQEMEKFINQLAKILVPFCPAVTPDHKPSSAPTNEQSPVSFDLASELSDELKEVTMELDANAQMTTPDNSPKEMRALKSMLAELNDPANNENISLLILRFAADLLPRAAFFMVTNDHVCGLGGFSSFPEDGDSNSLVQRIKNLRISLEGESVFQTVVNFRIPYRGFLPKSDNNELIAKTLGPERPTEVFVAPIISGNRVAAILYGDTNSSSGALENTQGLEIFLLQAGLAMERSLLERKLREASQH